MAHVLRCRVGQPVAIFNETCGEWAGTLTALDKKTAVITVGGCTRPGPESLPIRWLAVAPLKHDAMSFLIQKVTELGVTHIQLIQTDHTQGGQINYERLAKTARDAAQQCERLSVPVLLPLTPLGVFMKALPPATWFAACERLGEGAEFTLRHGAVDVHAPLGFLVGPEGGWSQSERALFGQHSGLTCIRLGGLILRAETAALVCLAQVMV
jgi:16S rRNA (uracil1498-N3)-methyltransferase